MKRSFDLTGLLLLATVPLLSQASGSPDAAKIGELLRFTMKESPADVVRLMGRPERVDNSSPAFESWQYEGPADEDHDDNSPPGWFICVRSGDRQLLSVTRNFGKPLAIDQYFPPEQSTVHYWPSKEAAQYSLRLRTLADDVLLLAMGVAKPGDRTTQLMLIRRSALKALMPWLAEQLDHSSKPAPQAADRSRTPAASPKK